VKLCPCLSIKPWEGKKGGKGNGAPAVFISALNGKWEVSLKLWPLHDLTNESQNGNKFVIVVSIYLHVAKFSDYVLAKYWCD
jgi:hypothetical protein